MNVVYNMGGMGVWGRGTVCRYGVWDSILFYFIEERASRMKAREFPYKYALVVVVTVVTET